MSQAAADVIRPILRDVRRRLLMDVALGSHLAEGPRVIDLIDTAEAVPFSPGDSAPVASPYCQQIVDGVLPEVLPDTAASSAALALAATRDLDGAHLGVPTCSTTAPSTGPCAPTRTRGARTWTSAPPPCRG